MDSHSPATSSVSGHSLDGDAHRPLLVVLSGAPASGKSTLGRALATALHVPLVSRDDIKTGMHVTHGSVDPAEHHRFAEPAFATFFDVVGTLLGAGVSVVAEAPFHAGRAERSLLDLGAGARLVHVAVRTPDAVSVRRYRERADAGVRHPAHADDIFAARLEAGEIDLARYRLELPVPTVEVDATDGWAPDLPAIVAFVVNG